MELTLENILRDAVPIPADKRCGIYFLIAKGAIVYIGQSPNYLRRVGEHLRYKDGIDAYYFLPCTVEELTPLERRLIEQFCPSLNVQKKFWADVETTGNHLGVGTKRALALITQGLTPYAAAKKSGIALSTIYNALKRQRERKQ